MPRIRTIKPEFWTDEKLSLLDVTTRLVFLGLISMADDAGRLVDNVKLLDGQIFPSTEDSCLDALDTLAKLSRITRYTSASGQNLIQITGWDRHQKIDHPNKHTLPAPPSSRRRQTPAPQPVAEPLAKTSREPREDLATVSRDPLATTLDLGPRTKDQGPRTKDQSSNNNHHHAREDVSEPVREALGDDLHAQLCDFVQRQRSWYWQAMGDALTGVPGFTLTPARLRGIVAEYVANEERPNLGRFRGYLQRAVAPPPANGHRGARATPSAGERMRASVERAVASVTAARSES